MFSFPKHYVRWNKQPIVADVPTPKPTPTSTFSPSSLDPPPPPPSPVQTNLDLLIAIWKGKHTYTYPMSSFVSMLVYLDFVNVLCLPFLFVFQTLSAALAHEGWHQAMLDMMHALEQNATWDLIPLSVGK